MKHTCSTIFLLHQLGIAKESLKEMGFQNAYLKDKNREKICDYQLFLLFKPEDFGNFNFYFEQEKERTNSLIDDYDYDNGYVVLVYKLPDKFKSDYEKFRKGEYSKFSKEFKKAYGKNLLAYDIINKTSTMKNYWTEKIGYDFHQDDDMEVWSSPSIETETLDIKKILSNAE